MSEQEKGNEEGKLKVAIEALKKKYSANEAGQILVDLELDPDDVLFNNHGDYEHQTDWLRDQLPNEFHGGAIGECMVMVLGYQLKKLYSPRLLVLQCTVEVEE